ncbi:protein angel homolog 2 isoform X8 [Macaca fascicularis]
MSYNILSQDLLEDNSHLYRHCRRPVLHWSFRFPNILKEIKHFDADVLCLQEVQEDHYGAEIRPSLESLEYSLVNIVQKYQVSGQEQSSRGQRILSIPIWPPNLGISQNCVYEVQQVPKVEKTDSDLTQTQLKQTEVLVTAEKLSSNLQHHFSLSSVYSHYFPDTGIPEVTTCHSRSAITVDYIFYSAEKEDVAGHPGAEVALVGGLKLLARLSLLTEQDLWTVNGLPNENNSSDHLPLLAKFRLEL